MINLIWLTIKERKWSIIIYTSVSVLLLLLYVSLFPSLQAQSQQLSDVLKSMPQNLLKALGSSADQMSNFTLEALLASKQFSIVFQLLAAVLAIALAGTDIAAEIENGTIEFLLSQPISRMKIYFGRLISETILLTIFAAASTLLTIPFAKAFGVAYVGSVYPKLFLLAWLFTMAFYAIAYCFSAISSSKGRVSAISAAIIVVMYVAFLISALKENLDKLKYISFFHYFSPEVLYNNSIDKWAVLVFALTIIIFIAIGAIVFQKRDIATS